VAWAKFFFNVPFFHSLFLLVRPESLLRQAKQGEKMRMSISPEEREEKGEWLGEDKSEEGE